jgi:hypothetical protein
LRKNFVDRIQKVEVSLYKLHSKILCAASAMAFARSTVQSDIRDVQKVKKRKLTAKGVVLFFGNIFVKIY